MKGTGTSHQVKGVCGIMRGVAVAITICAFLAGTQPASAGTLTLRDAIAESLSSNNALKISREKLRESRLQVRESWGMLWPELSSDVSLTRQWAESGINSSIDGQYDVKIVNGTLAVNPGAFYHGLMASRKGYIIAEKDVRRIKADTAIRTIKLYYQVLLARESITLQRDSLKSLEENLRVVTTGYRRGTFSKLDYLRARVAMSNQKTVLINSENQYMTARATLNIQLGRDINDPLDADPSAVRGTPDMPLNLPLSGDAGKKAVENMIATALRNRPELIQIKLRKQVLDETARASESVFLWPTIFISGSYGTSKVIQKDEGSIGTLPAPFDTLSEEINKSFAPPGWNNSWMVTFGATYRWGSLVPFDSAWVGSKKIRSQARQTAFEMDDFIKGVRLEVQSGYLKLKSASSSILSQKGNIQTAEETLRAARIQFRNGIIDNTKLLEANLQLTTARTLYIQSLHDFQVAKAELNRALGVDYFTIE